MKPKTSPIITVFNLHKHFKIFQHRRGFIGTIRNFLSTNYSLVRAVDGVSFNVQSGELVGYIGPNGAGKSTTIKMLTGLLVPTMGELRVNGFLPWKDRKEYVSRIGAVFGQRTTLWWDLPVIDSFDLLKHIYKIPQKNFEYKMKEFQEILEINTFLYTPVRSLSLGQRMRADLCAALLHEPEIFFWMNPRLDWMSLPKNAFAGLSRI